MGKIKVEIKSEKSTFYDSTVRAICQQLKHCDEIEGAKRYFQYDLERIPRTSTSIAMHAYKVVDIQNGFEVHHLNSKGDSDRVLAIITYEK